MTMIGDAFTDVYTQSFGAVCSLQVLHSFTDWLALSDSPSHRHTMLDYQAIKAELDTARLQVKRLERKARSEQRIILAEKNARVKRMNVSIYKIDALKMLAYLESTGFNLKDFQSAANRYFSYEG